MLLLSGSVGPLGHAIAERLSLRRRTADTLAAALMRASRDPAFARRAGQLGARIREEDGVVPVLAAVDRWSGWDWSRAVLGAVTGREGWPAGLPHPGATPPSVTLLLLALLKNAEMRAEHAVQRKLDAIAAALLEVNKSEAGKAFENLRNAIRMEEET